MHITMEEILKRIETADDFEINEIMNAVQKRFAIAFPDWEVIYLSFPKNDFAERQQALKIIATYLQTQ